MNNKSYDVALNRDECLKENYPIINNDIENEFD